MTESAVEQRSDAGDVDDVGGARLRVVRRRGWVTFEADETDAGGDARCGTLGRPGLWKAVGRDGGPPLEFDVPADLVDRRAPDPWAENWDPPGPTPLEQVAAWAAACLAEPEPGGGAGFLAGWAPPPKAEVDLWVPEGGLTVEHGAVARHGRVVHGPNRLAVSLPLLTAVPQGLSPRRLQWLQALLDDARGRWRMVRIGTAGVAEGGGTDGHGPEFPPGAAVEAEIDLTGTPACVLEPLFRRSVAALHLVVRWLAPSAAVVVDPAAGPLLDAVPPPSWGRASIRQGESKAPASRDGAGGG